MNPYRNLYEPAITAPELASSREVPFTFAILGAVSAVQVATAWHAHGVQSGQTLIGLAFLLAGAAGFLRTRSSWTTSSSSC